MALKTRDCKSAQQWLNENGFKFFYCQVDGNSLREGVRNMMQCAGLGQMRPNILTMGFKSNFNHVEEIEKSLEYFEIIHDAYDMFMGVMIVRIREHNSDLWPNEGDDKKTTTDLTDFKIQTTNREFTIQCTSDDNTLTDSGSNLAIPQDTKLEDSPIIEALAAKHKGSIDVWWLFDDGGLSALLPYMLSQSRKWKDCQLRVFSIIHSSEDKETIESMAHLLSLLRIKCESIHVVDHFDEAEEAESLAHFNGRLSVLMEHNGKDSLMESDIIRNETKTLQHVRLRNCVRKYSVGADVVFITMIVPRKKSIPGLLYLSWLDYVSEAHPTVCFVRGNQENVLTYYT
ncbi:hypothetical protein ACOME3_005545 [Neoechinorhynchus agilis]